jgi:hypothetical protein
VLRQGWSVASAPTAADCALGLHEGMRAMPWPQTLVAHIWDDRV